MIKEVFYMVLTCDDEIVGIYHNKENAEKAVVYSTDRIEEFCFDD